MPYRIARLGHVEIRGMDLDRDEELVRSAFYYSQELNERFFKVYT